MKSSLSVQHLTITGPHSVFPTTLGGRSWKVQFHKVETERLSLVKQRWGIAFPFDSGSTGPWLPPHPCLSIVWDARFIDDGAMDCCRSSKR
jgi:hypothetical protein